MIIKVAAFILTVFLGVPTRAGGGIGGVHVDGTKTSQSGILILSGFPAQLQVLSGFQA